MLCVYVATGVIFALIYSVNRDAVQTSDGCALSGFWESLYFSFVTQATLGYGDFSPQSSGARLLATLQASIGMTWGAVALGVVTYSLLRRVSNIEMADSIVYDPSRHEFMIRFVNLNADAVRNAVIEALVRKESNAQGYDTVASAIALRYDRLSVMPPAHLFLLRTVTNEGQVAEAFDGHNKRDAPILLAPDHLDDPSAWIVVAVSGLYESGGESVFLDKSFRVRDGGVRCGEFVTINQDTEYRSFSVRYRGKLAAQYLNSFEPTTPDACIECGFYPTCPLEPATTLRDGPEKRSQS